MSIVKANPQEGDLSVWWIPQVPGTPFRVSVPDLAAAKLLLRTLAAYDQFQLDQNIKPDYCNVGGLSVWEGGEWLDWYDEEGNDIDDLILVDVRAEG